MNRMNFMYIAGPVRDGCDMLFWLAYLYKTGGKCDHDLDVLTDAASDVDCDHCPGCLYD